MKHYVTIYIDPITDWQGFTHAFLGLSHTHPDDLDKQDKQIREEKLKKADWKDFDKKWYESVEINDFNDGFWGFGAAGESIGLFKRAAGKVFNNNHYIMDNDVKTNTYKIKKLRSNQTFKNRCTLEVSQEQYDKLLQDIKNDYETTKAITPRSEASINDDFTYNVFNNNCTTWVLNKLDSIGIEVIDVKEWIPDNISARDSLLSTFHYLKFYNNTFLKFQNIDENLKSIKGAKAFRQWTRSMIDNNYICYVDESALEKQIQGFCKRDIDNQRYYESIKKFYKIQAQLKSIYERLNTLLEKIIQKCNNTIKGDFELIYWDKQANKIKFLKAENDYNPIIVENFNLNILANNCSISKFYPFIFIPKDKILSRMLYHKYDYGKVSESYQSAANEFYLNVLAGIQSDKYWSKSYHKLSKINKQFQPKELENV
ncbi:hypothetical protein OQH60_08325 [Campylobacter sp. MIT 21-1685]|uniref:hypothetical protein n=1 Tax=unclassified Campylobacter TaxID=2593542 RepID=UPI00224B90F2|nr:MULTISPECIES: hypothetical protein [unclassified Campylobacter]MCX2683861.1 hypothetical protein [Campylobacter sp. MIT 21-1684]MCX2752145.1 hypothetical protein [Campylobacter sp. MIT 21-1682]MCX2808338.1 hypothetical protein [Campylobacter sp. MIT 21-1685]